MKAIIDFTQQHREWAIPVVFALAYCESFSFVSLLVPATSILLALGLVFRASGLDFFPIWSATALGAALGGIMAYELGFRYQRQILTAWPFRRFTVALDRGGRLFARYGLIAVFLCRFSAPIRATVPMLAGVYQFPFIQFHIANLGSAVVWATGILLPGLAWPF